jgi:cytochrome oxidase Cu insertion factor (SCO1/SenC/PrrC family)
MLHDGGMRATVVLSALVVLATLALACADPQTEQTARAGTSTDVADEKPDAGEGAVRDFSVTSFSGDDFTLSARRGSPVVLNFFESW